MTTAATLTAEDPHALTATAAPAQAPLARVLLIEDNQEEMLLVQYTLEEFGQGRYELEWANRLGPGIDRVRDGGLDLVLLDLGLPECQGPVSYVAIRDAAPEIPVLVLTGDHRAQTEEVVMNLGAEDYLVKEEISGLQLLHAIRGAMYRKKTRLAKRPGASG
jgi:DNA-binding response OmpR family regulator